MRTCARSDRAGRPIRSRSAAARGTRRRSTRARRARDRRRGAPSPPAMRSTASRVHGTTSSTHSGRAEITSIGGGSGASSASRTVSQQRRRLDRLVHVLERLFAHRLQQRLRRVVGGHDDDARPRLARAQLRRADRARSCAASRRRAAADRTGACRSASSASTPSLATVAVKPALGQDLAAGRAACRGRRRRRGFCS